MSCLPPAWCAWLSGEHLSASASSRSPARCTDSCGACELSGSRLFRRLRKYQGQIDELFHSTLDELRIELPDLGQVQALDGKELHSLANGPSSYPQPKDKVTQDTDGRRDRDAEKRGTGGSAYL